MHEEPQKLAAEEDYHIVPLGRGPATSPRKKGPSREKPQGEDTCAVQEDGGNASCLLGDVAACHGKTWAAWLHSSTSQWTGAESRCGGRS